MALKDEFEYISKSCIVLSLNGMACFSIAFRCAYCFHINPARKKRESAPKLMKTPSIDRLERLPFPPVQETNEKQESASNSVTTSPLPSPANTTPTPDQLLIPEKGKNKLYLCNIF